MAITTPPVRISYPNLFTARAAQPGQTPKYSVVLMFDKSNPDHKDALKALHAEATAALEARWPDPAARPRVPLVGADRSPIKDGDTARDNQGIPLAEKNPEYAGHFIIRASTTRRPVVVDRQMQEVLNQDMVYGGCECKVNLNAYAYDTSGNKGVTFGLNGAQFWAEGESFGGGRPSVESMFSKAASESPDAYSAPDPFANAKAPNDTPQNAAPAVDPFA